LGKLFIEPGLEAFMQQARSHSVIELGWHKPL
jgi:hypothetical protein